MEVLRFSYRAINGTSRGYFENREIVALNNGLILGNVIPIKYWLAPEGEKTLIMRIGMPIAQLGYVLRQNSATIARRAQKKKDAIKSFSRKYKNCAVKDPRFSLTIGHWKQYGSVRKAMYCYRDPYEVAASIKRRNHAPLRLCDAMWRHHVAEFLENACGVPIVFVDYNNFFDDSKKYDEAKRLFVFAGKPYTRQKARELLGSVLEDWLRHNAGSTHKIPPAVEEMYQKLHVYHSVSAVLRPLS